MDKTPKIVEPTTEMTIIIDNSEGFGSVIEVEFSQTSTPSENPAMDALSKTHQEPGSPTPLDSNPIFLQIFEEDFTYEKLNPSRSSLLLEE